MLVATYVILTIFDPGEQLGSHLILACLAYLFSIWSSNILRLIRNVYGQSGVQRLLFGAGLPVVGIIFSTWLIGSQNGTYAQRFFSVGPILYGITFFISKDMETVLKSKAIWKWWDLPLPNYLSFAAIIYGMMFIARGLLNEVFIAIGNEWVWIFSCALLPIVVLWIGDVMIIRGLLARGAVHRTVASD